MPPPPKGAAAATAQNKKKKKGHAPAHQNKFAFTHNPKSKLTEKILTSPNIHVCQRCYDKIEWRKQYRKYKPRTQPGTCNGCQKRNVRSAYHTICTNCTTESVKAKEIINNAAQLGSESQQNNDNEDDDTMKDESTTTRTTTLTTRKPMVVRACAVCVKEIALPDLDDDKNTAEEDAIAAAGRIRLRERKALERKLAKEAAAAAAAERGSDGTTDNNDNINDSDEEHDNDTKYYGRTAAAAEHSGMSMSEIEEEEQEDNDDDDPFLKAVGGADKLLTGEAYQQKLLAQLERQGQK